MKKTINFFFAFILAVSLNSCSGSDSEKNSGSSSSDKIVGTWKYTGDMYMGTFEPYDGDSCDDEFYKFFGNNTGKFIEKYCDDVDDTLPFTWAKTNDPIFNYSVTTPDGEFPAIVVFSEDFTKFTLYETEEDMLEEDAGEVFEK